MNQITQTEDFRAWLGEMNARARKCREEDGGPEIGTGCYAIRKLKGTWKVSTGRSWWNDPEIVEEIHEYRDGTVCAHYYVEGVKTFGQQSILTSGMKAVRPADLPGYFQPTKIVYYDHRRLNERDRSVRIVYDHTGAQL